MGKIKAILWRIRAKSLLFLYKLRDTLHHILHRHPYTGRQIVVNGQIRTIVEYDAKTHVTTVGEDWATQPGSSDWS